MTTCNDQLGTLPADAGAFTALVRFTDASAGDQLNAIAHRTGGHDRRLPVHAAGRRERLLLHQLQTSNLPAGDYTLTATRNGDEVATTTFRARS